MWKKLLLLLRWVIAVVFNTKHLEDVIKDYIGSDNTKIIEPVKGLFIVNDAKLATKILCEEDFNMKGQFDTKFGVYSFQPFTLQQLTNGDEWKRYYVLKVAIEEGKCSEVTPIAMHFARQFVSKVSSDEQKYSKGSDLLEEVRPVVLKTAIAMAFGREFSEQSVQAICAGIRNLDEYIKRVATMDMKARIGMREAVKAELSNQKILFAGRSTSFVAILKNKIAEGILDSTDEELLQYACTVLLTSFTIQVTDLVCHVMAVLSKHPEVRDQALAEIFNLYQRSPNSRKSSELNELQVLSRVIKETMRLYPLNPLLGRASKVDTTLDGKPFAKGSEFTISCTALHRVGWENPEEFDINHFGPNNSKFSGVYIPFGLGPRSCPAGNFGVNTAKAIISVLLQHLHVRTLEGYEHRRALWYGVPVVMAPITTDIAQLHVPKISTVEHFRKHLNHYLLAKVLPVSAWLYGDNIPK